MKLKDFCYLIVIGFLFIYGCHKKNQFNNSELLYSGLSDSLEIFINEDGNQEANIKIIESKSRKQFLSIKSKDREINWLKTVVDDYKGKLDNAIVLINSTNSVGSTNTIVLDVIDSVLIDSVVYLYPKYKTEWSNEWENGFILASKDSIFRDIKMKNKFEIELGEMKNGWFKKREYTVNVSNLNPNTFTEGLRSISFKEKPKKLSLGLNSGVGIDLISRKTVIYLGLGVSFNLIGIR